MNGRSSSMFVDVAGVVCRAFEEHIARAHQLGGAVRIPRHEVVRRCTTQLNDRYQGVLAQGESFTQFVRDIFRRYALSYYQAEPAGYYDFYVG